MAPLGLVGLAALVSMASCDKHREIEVRFTGFSGPLELLVFDARAHSCASLLETIAGDTAALPAPLDSARPVTGTATTLARSFAAGDYTLLAWSDPGLCRLEALGCAQVTLGGSSDPGSVTIRVDVVPVAGWCAAACAATVECGGTGDAGVDSGPCAAGRDCCSAIGAPCSMVDGPPGQCCAGSGGSFECVVEGADACAGCAGAVEATPCQLPDGSAGECHGGVCRSASCSPPFQPDASGCAISVEAYLPEGVSGGFGVAGFWYQLDGRDPDEFEGMPPVLPVRLPPTGGSTLRMRLTPPVPGDPVRVCDRDPGCSASPDCVCVREATGGDRELAFGAIGMGDWAPGGVISWPTTGAVGTLLLLWSSAAMEPDTLPTIPHFAALRVGTDGGARFAAPIPMGLSVWRSGSGGEFVPADLPLADRLVPCTGVECAHVLPVPQQVSP